MHYKNYYEFQEDYTHLMRLQNYDAALKLISQAHTMLSKEEFDERQFDLLFDESRVHTLTQNSDACINTIKKVLNIGYAFPLTWTRFAFLKDHFDYEKLYRENLGLLEKLQESSFFKYEVILPKGYSDQNKVPLFICLHGDGFGCNIKDTQYHWNLQALVDHGCMVVYAQSSQAYCHNSFGWLENLERSRNELKGLFHKLVNQYAIDESRIAIGGFSGGASTAIDVVANKVIPAKGIMALCPGDHLETINLEAFKEMVHNNVKIAIFEGEEDLDPVTAHLLKVFDRCGLDYMYGINKGIGHEYPKNLSSKTLKTMGFLEVLSL